MINKINFNAISLSKKYSKQLLFSNLSLNLENGTSTAVTGCNGSGKSTLLKILSGLIESDSGSITLEVNKNRIDNYQFNNYIGFTSPEINPYPMLNAIENIKFVMKDFCLKTCEELLNDFNLYKHRKKPVKEFSSGMIQRLRLITSIINRPDILILDEPGTNLDKEGKDILYHTIENYKKDRALVIATNDMAEVNLCEKELSIK